MSEKSDYIDELDEVGGLAPPGTFTIWTLKADGTQSSQLGGATDQPSACALAAQVAATLRVGIAVYQTSGPTLVAYLKSPQTTTPP